MGITQEAESRARGEEAGEGMVQEDMRRQVLLLMNEERAFICDKCRFGVGPEKNDLSCLCSSRRDRFRLRSGRDQRRRNAGTCVRPERVHM